MSESCEFLIVGGGSAGCVLAHELVVRHGRRVTLIEPESATAPAADRQRPARWLHLLGSAEDWNLPTAACDQLAGRAIRWPRGRGLGGSSRLNAMIWFPPTAGDLQRLADAADGHWRAEELREAAVRAEMLAQPESPRWLSEASRRFLEAAREIAGAEPIAYRRSNRGGRRWTPAALLEGAGHPAVPTSGGAAGKLRILRASVARVLWQGDVACGVEVDDRGQRRQLTASQGVVLCAGAIGTPAILMRSGVGPRQPLRALGIEVRIPREAVGGNLQDHLIMPVVFRLERRWKFDPGWTLRDLAHWQHAGGGRLTSNIAEVGGLFDDQRVQIHVTPTHYLAYPASAAPPAMTLGVSVTQPASRGRVTIRSADPAVPPEIEPGYLSEPCDLDATVEAVRRARAIAEQPPLAGWVGEEMVPGAKRSSEAQLSKAIARYAQTLYHPVGTCALGSEAASAVDAKFRVRGAEKLWVVDASTLPGLTLGNPNATVMALAVHAATMLPD